MLADFMENTGFKVVLNQEEQYSLWPANRPNAAGWMDAGFSGRKEDCLAYIRANWIDMRPLSLREKMALDKEARGCTRAAPTMSVQRNFSAAYSLAA